jgi:lysophospholipase L1-like esterase
VLVFGDSYTQGAGADPNTLGYAYQLGHQLGWNVTVDGVGGTGYVNPGPRKTGAFLDRLASAAPGPFDLIVLQGSSNDEREPLADLAPAVDQTVLAFRAKYPTARIVLLGPIALYGSVPAPKAAVNDTLKDYAASHRLSFIDAIAESWFAHGESKTMANPVNGHPSNEGHVRIRDRLVIDLSRLTAAPAPA